MLFGLIGSFVGGHDRARVVETGVDAGKFVEITRQPVWLQRIGHLDENSPVAVEAQGEFPLGWFEWTAT